jgi:conjugative relaxase-like TrwC/TraI family protein
VGKGVADLGLSGNVDADDFRAVFAGDHPVTGERLAAANRTLPGYDLCFSPPKSVSVLFGLGGADTAAAVVRCHEEAVEAALSWLEDTAAVTRIGHNGVERTGTTGVVGAAFRHRSSRELDPQLHTHIVVGNLVKGDDGKWRTLDGRGLYLNAKAASLLYGAHLRWALTRELGVDWGPMADGHAEVNGIPAHVLRLFSKRRGQIEECMADRGESSWAAARVAALRTRRPKDRTVDARTLAAGWRHQAAEAGFGPEGFAAVLGRAEAVAVDEATWETIAARLSSPQGLTERASTFALRDVVAAFAGPLRPGSPVSEIEAHALAYLARPEVVRLVGGRYSTADMLAVERAALAAVRRRHDDGAAVVAEDDLAAALAARPSLEPEQVAMARSLTTSGDGAAVVSAPAGAGKTFALDACREAWERAGLRVVGCSWTARAAAELQAGSGIPSSTVASLLIDLDRPESVGLDARCVLVVDESGTAGTRVLARLLDKANGAKVVLVGDKRQLPEIAAGGLFARLADSPGAVRLVGNRRQRETWERAALADLRDGDVGAALAAYDSRGRIVRGDGAVDVRESMTADWWAATVAGESALMLAPRRAEADDLNARARLRMARAGRLSGPELVAGERPFQAGDRVLTLRNDRRVGVLNGTRGTVAAVDIARREMVVATDAGPTVVLPARYLDAGHVAHGYAVTAHKAQGATVDRAMLLGTDAVYRELGYVGMSRGRLANTLYVVGRPEDADDTHHGAAKYEQPDELVLRALTASRAKTLAVDADRPGVEARLHSLHAEQARLQVVLVGAPPDPFRDRTALTSARERAVARVAAAETRRAACRPSRWSRRATAEQAWAEAGLSQALAGLERVDAELAVIAGKETERRAWLDAHADDMARADALRDELPGVLAERLVEVERHCPRYIEDTLGRPPGNEAARDRWRAAVKAVESYRAAEGVTDPGDPLGPRRDAENPTLWDGVSRVVAEAKTAMALALDPSTGVAVGQDFGIGL